MLRWCILCMKRFGEHNGPCNSEEICSKRKMNLFESTSPSLTKAMWRGWWDSSEQRYNCIDCFLETFAEGTNIGLHFQQFYGFTHRRKLQPTWWQVTYFCTISGKKHPNQFVKSFGNENFVTSKRTFSNLRRYLTSSTNFLRTRKHSINDLKPQRGMQLLIQSTPSQSWLVAPSHPMLNQVHEIYTS